MDKIEIVDYDPAWPKMFEVEADLLRNTLPSDLMLDIEHFGSTAVPGLAAKPIIDILVAVPSIEKAKAEAVQPMEAVGYAFWADNPMTDRLFFVKGLPPAAARRTHHVHMTEHDGELWERLLFRDYLRAHTDEARRYESLKREWLNFMLATGKPIPRSNTISLSRS